jgi:hypothetical protein
MTTTAETPDHVVPGASLVTALNPDALVDYFRCQSCGAVWNLPKGQVGPVHMVTKPPDQNGRAG